MTKESGNRSKDIQGAGKLAVDAVIGITDIVESMHHTITSFGGIMGEPDQTRTKGIAGMVYKNIRTITEIVGEGLDIPLNRLSSMIEESEFSPGREAVLSALNGVLGDYLVARDNPLAISMRFRREGQPLSEEELSELIRQSSGRLAIMVHGSSMNDLQWNREGHDHGAALSRDLGITPIYLHYNTGLHTSENGRTFTDLLEALPAPSSQPIELFIIAHSMGGLVSRSACHYGKRSGHTWLKHLKKLVFIGTPHHGAPLEKGGNWIENLLEINPYSAPFVRLGKIRSSGVTDLRFGNLIEEDWEGRDRFSFSRDKRTPVPLPAGVKSYAIAATTGKEKTALGDNLIGDGLVTVESALGNHKNQELDLQFPENHRWIGRNMNHWDLLNHPEVYNKILNFLSES
ncbi:MAG: hypothetical protein GY795_03295 [Desulfobacterales bacterium]|nr:hypothetical protein [Desulfobacterales bacterium]